MFFCLEIAQNVHVGTKYLMLVALICGYRSIVLSQNAVMVVKNSQESTFPSKMNRLASCAGQE